MYIAAPPPVCVGLDVDVHSYVDVCKCALQHLQLRIALMHLHMDHAVTHEFSIPPGEEYVAHGMLVYGVWLLSSSKPAAPPPLRWGHAEQTQEAL